MPRLQALAREWRKTPPLVRILAAAFGVRANEPRSDLAGFVRAMTGGALPD